MEGLQPLFIVLIVVIFIGLAIYGRIRARQRREYMRKLALSKGWQYRPVKDYQMDERFGVFGC
ncbi:MAG: hypothetical protein ACYTBZ_27300, partial [Planctomycetota bacterium]